MDNIKKYLLENRSSLDTDVPGEGHWEKLADKVREMNRARERRDRRLIGLGIAAAFLLAVAGFVLWKGSGTSNRMTPAQVAGTSPQATAPQPTAPQAEAVDHAYSPVIHRELAGLKKTSFYGHNRADFKIFSLQWKELEANEKTIEQHMRTVGPTDRLIQQLADNYQLKIRLLQQFAIEINKVKNFLPPADTLEKTPSLSILGINTLYDENK